MAEAADLAANQLNHIIGPNPIRNLGEQLARKIEANVGLPLGSLDIPSESSAQYLSNLDVENSTFINALSIKVPFNSNECLFENIREGIVLRSAGQQAPDWVQKVCLNTRWMRIIWPP